MCGQRRAIRQSHALREGSLEVAPHPGWRLRRARVGWTYPAAAPAAIRLDGAPRAAADPSAFCGARSRRYVLRDGPIRVAATVGVQECAGITVRGRRGPRSFFADATAHGYPAGRPLGLQGAVLSPAGPPPVLRAEFSVCRGVATCVDYLFFQDQRPGGVRGGGRIPRPDPTGLAGASPGARRT